MFQLNEQNKALFAESTSRDLERLLYTIQEKGKNVFTIDNFIDDKELNELGVQVYRTLAYDQQFNTLRENTKLFNSEYHQYLNENGYIKVTDLFDDETFSKIESAFISIVAKHGRLSPSANLPLTVDVRSHELLQELCRLCQADPTFNLESFYTRKVIHSAPGHYCDDARQYFFHYDKFYPNYKLWFYVEERKEEDGPTACFRGSHKNTKEKLQWFYRSSVELRDTHPDWSRISLDAYNYIDKVEEVGFKEEVRLVGKPNTLYVVDTRCLHRRTPVSVGTPRISLRAILPRLEKINAL